MNGALWLLPLFAVGYALWAFFRLRRMERNEPADGIVAEDTPCRQEIIGRSRFVLDPRHSRPQAAVESETEKVTEKADIFVPTNVPEHPRQIPPEDWMKCSVSLPRGSLTNLWKSTFRCTMNLSRMRTRRSRIMTRMKTTPKSCPFGPLACPGVSFEQMGEAYRHVVHDPPSTDEQREETGRVLLGLKQTDMFEVIVSGRPDGNDRVKSLIDTYLSAFHRRMSERSAESPSPQGSVPTGFDVREFV